MRVRIGGSRMQGHIRRVIGIVFLLISAFLLLGRTAGDWLSPKTSNVKPTMHVSVGPSHSEKPEASTTRSTLSNRDITIAAIRQRPSKFIGKKVMLDGFFGDPRGENTGIPHSRSDWSSYDRTGAIYVSGIEPPVHDRYGRNEWGTRVKVFGIIRQTKDQVPYIAALEVKRLP